jgi:serine/threonine protein kinase
MTNLLHKAGASGISSSLDDKVKVVVDLALALDFVHEQSVVHLDLKPSNILYDRVGVIKILDFGMARFAAVNRFRSGGTLAYMAPERLKRQPGFICMRRPFSPRHPRYRRICAN